MSTAPRSARSGASTGITSASCARDLTDLLSYGAESVSTGLFDAWHEEIAELKREYCLNYDRDSDLIQPYAVIEEINKHTKGEAIISTGVGQHQMWAAQYFDYREPRLWLTSGSMGTMGFGLPAAIGAQFAQPDRVVIDIDGDGSMRMNIGELETATTYKLPIKVVVLNNYGDGMVRQWQKLYYGSRLSASDKSLHSKDFVKAAEADGFEFAKKLDRKEDIESVVAEFMATPGPAFLEVIIDPEAGVYPHGRPGPLVRQDDHRRLHQEPQQTEEGQGRPQRDVLGRFRGFPDHVGLLASRLDPVHRYGDANRKNPHDHRIYLGPARVSALDHRTRRRFHRLQLRGAFQRLYRRLHPAAASAVPAAGSIGTRLRQSTRQVSRT